MFTDYLPWIIAAAVVLIGVIAWLVLRRREGGVGLSRGARRARPHRDSFRPDGESVPVPLKHAGVVINPTKFDDQTGVRSRIAAISQELGWGDPQFYETTEQDPGTGQARQAVEDGATVVCSLGGDGTVRSVASALIGTETPLGLLPAGTGNLLARNLDLPIDSIDTAVRVALTGRNRRIDVGELTVGAEGDEANPQQKHYFVVMAGMGMDAAVMADTNEKLKSAVGWPAYMVSGVKNLLSPEFRASIKLDSDPPFRRFARAIIIGNCGKLLGGLVLMPDARVDDGQLDVVIAAPKGFVGWAPVFTRVITRRRKGHPTLDHKECAEIRVHTEHAQQVQVDGDVITEATEISADVIRGALTVRVSQT